MSAKTTRGKFKFAIDRGGTFTDVYCLCPPKISDEEVSGNEAGYYPVTMKLLSEDPANYKDAPTEAIRRILQSETGIEFRKSDPIDASFVDSIRMGTTVATNALLERKGEPMLLLITKGFKDLLHIGNQCRPNLFDLSITLPEKLYDSVIEVDERLYLDQQKCQLDLTQEFKDLVEM